ncbi:toxin-antitoxin system YwqK family antitoxin [Zhouia sp. PK063]|uniref:toxin-antitoxin system YwqK family antitoxin n=1 Tax=Zhouia sp. PK063 TaxID=3373602 RepID=UPI0037B698FC
MKKVVVVMALLFSAMMFAQKPIEPRYEVQGKLVKATFYHANGKVAQTGFYKEGKPDGEWKAYDAKGNKIAIAQYAQGKKVGKWFFWKDNKLSEVDYSDNRVANVTEWKNANPVAVNK